jgi:hypothetical protein
MAVAYRSVMSVVRWGFADLEVTSAGGASVRIPAGEHAVERRSLVYRMRLGGREVDLTLAEFERLQRAGLVWPVSGVAS